MIREEKGGFLGNKIPKFSKKIKKIFKKVLTRGNGGVII